MSEAQMLALAIDRIIIQEVEPHDIDRLLYAHKTASIEDIINLCSAN